VIEEVGRSPGEMALARHVVSFVRRGSRMTEAQRNWLTRHGPRYLVEVERTDRVTAIPPQPPLDLARVFGPSVAGATTATVTARAAASISPTTTSPAPPASADSSARAPASRARPLVVEIGSGHGETLAFAAARHPETDYLGFEVFAAGLASTVGALAAARVDNVRLVAGDGVQGLRHLLTEGSCAELWVYFPDPWHKSRHHKRRLVSPSFVTLAASRLRPGGRLRLATDWPDYADWIEQVLADRPEFARRDEGRPADRPLTKYEARGLAQGRAIHDSTWVRRGRPDD